MNVLSKSQKKLIRKTLDRLDGGPFENGTNPRIIYQRRIDENTHIVWFGLIDEWGPERPEPSINPYTFDSPEAANRKATELVIEHDCYYNRCWV